MRNDGGDIYKHWRFFLVRPRASKRPAPPPPPGSARGKKGGKKTKQEKKKKGRERQGEDLFVGGGVIIITKRQTCARARALSPSFSSSAHFSVGVCLVTCPLFFLGLWTGPGR